jgi:GTP cyclohydrolase III
MARDRESDDSKTDRQLLLEIAGRARRTETKATLVANHIGVEAGETKPLLDPVKMILWVKTPRTSIEDIMAALPEHLEDHQGVDVYCGEDYMLTVSKL